MTTIDDVLTAVAAQVILLDFTEGTSGIPVVVYKVPARQAGIDPATQIVICPSRTPGGEKPRNFGQREYTHLVDVILFASGLNDLITNLPEYTTIIQTMLIHFAKPLDWAIPSRKVTSRPVKLFDPMILARAKIDCLAIEVAVTVVEQVVS